MRGKVTFLKGRHPTQEGEWIAAVELSADVRVAMERALGRSLNVNESVAIADTVSSYRALMKSSGDRVTRQDVIATLSALAELDDATAANAVRNMDAFSEAQITYAVLKGARVQDAARSAVARMRAEKSVGGGQSKGYQYFAIRAALSYWQRLGQIDMRVAWQNHDRGYKASPLVDWTRAFLSAIDEKPHADPRNIASMIEAAIRTSAS